MFSCLFLEQGEQGMNEKELKKEAGNWLRKYLLCCNCEKKCNCIDSNSYCEEQVLKAYVDSAEPREKQIQIDAEQIRALQKQNGELTDKVKELEAQIEKMKCCENCQHWEGREPIPSLAEEGYYCFNDYPFECKRWELAEELKEIKENEYR